MVKNRPRNSPESNHLPESTGHRRTPPALNRDCPAPATNAPSNLSILRYPLIRI